MSPVSRGRKKKKQGKKGRGGGAVRVPVAGSMFRPGLFGQPRRPGWFDPALHAALEGTDSLLAAGGPRELEESAARVIGAQLHEALQQQSGLRFGAWTEELIAAAAQRVQDSIGTDGARQGAWRLLHAMTSIGTAPLAGLACEEIDEVRTHLPFGTVLEQPTWLAEMPAIAATGDLWQMRDVYGGRIGFIAGFHYPESADRFVYLLDFDVCGFVTLVHADVFDDVDEAATAWRALVGEAGRDASPRPIGEPDDLQCLVHWDTGELHLIGNETRAVMDNWYRAPRRVEDLLATLHKQGIRLPEAGSLYHDIDIAPTVEAFTDWYAARHGVKPDAAATEALAAEWLEGTLPGSEHVASPHRVEFLLGLMGDWISDDPITIGAKALLPDWVRWHGEQSFLPEPLIEAAVAVAAGGARTGMGCPTAW